MMLRVVRMLRMGVVEGREGTRGSVRWMKVSGRGDR